MQPEKWKPLAGAASEALVLAFGRRPELGGQIVSDWPEESARAFPLPFRLLVVFGGYGRAGDGRTFAGRILPDGKIDEFSKDHALDFDFGQVFSSEPGTVCIFKPRAGTRGSSLAADGGYARFQSLTTAEGLRFLTSAGRWSVPNLRGRVFLVEGVPKDGHLVGYPAVRALLTGKPLEPRLEVEAIPGESGRGYVELSVRATNAGPTPTDLSHYNNWIQIRVEGGTVALVKPGDFDRYEQLTSEADGYKLTSSSGAVVARLFENIFAPGERNQSGPIRVAGTHPRVFLSWHLTLPDGKVANGPEIEATPAAPAAAATAAPKPKLRGRALTPALGAPAQPAAFSRGLLGEPHGQERPRTPQMVGRERERHAPARRLAPEEQRLVAPGRFHGAGEILGVDDVECVLLRAEAREKAARLRSVLAEAQLDAQEMAMKDAAASRENRRGDRPSQEDRHVVRDALFERVRVGRHPEIEGPLCCENVLRERAEGRERERLLKELVERGLAELARGPVDGGGDSGDGRERLDETNRLGEDERDRMRREKQVSGRQRSRLAALRRDDERLAVADAREVDRESVVHSRREKTRRLGRASAQEGDPARLESVVRQRGDEGDFVVVLGKKAHVAARPGGRGGRATRETSAP